MEKPLTMLMPINMAMTNEYSMHVDMNRMWEKVTDHVVRKLEKISKIERTEEI